MQGSRYCDFTLSFCLSTDGPETVHLNLWEIFIQFLNYLCLILPNHYQTILSVEYLLFKN